MNRHLISMTANWPLHLSGGRLRTLAWLWVFGLQQAAYSDAATYYVATSGKNANSGSLQSPWRTIGHAASRVAAGDIVRVQAGTYPEAVTQTTDGAAGQPITYVADGAVVVSGIFTLDGSDYVRLVGFNFDRNLDRTGRKDALQLWNVAGCEIWDCNFRGYLRTGIWFASIGGGTNSDRCVIIGNTFTGRNGSAGVDAESNHLSLCGDDNLISHNVFNGANEDYIMWFGNRNRIVNNYGHNPNSASAAHVDFIQTGTKSIGNSYTLVEGNLYLDSDVASGHHHFSNMSNSGGDFTYLLLRRNVIHKVGTGIQGIFQNWARVYAVNETYCESQRHSSQAKTRYGSVYASSSVKDTRIYNCIFVETWGSSVTAPMVLLAEGSGFLHDYNLAWDRQGGSPTWSPPFSSERRKVTGDPSFVSYASADFRLSGNSPAINAAGPLTTVTRAGGTGTSFDVTDAGFFRGNNRALSQYGGGLIVGDTITVGTDVLTISGISGNTITVTTNFTWAQNDPVFLGNDPTPDIGAFPANHKPLTAATLSQNGNDYTVTPNGDARFVVFYVDGIPNTVDNASPYTAKIASGAVTARAYAFYASTTPVVAAIPAAHNP